MNETLHPAASHSLPWFITAPGQTDYLYNGAIIFLLVAVLFAGSLYLQLHSLPERMAHDRNKHQVEIVAVLGLLGLFTHNNLFWVAALLLTLVHIPDFSTPLAAIAQSLARIAGGGQQAGDGGPATEPEPDSPQVAEPEMMPVPAAPEPLEATLPDGDNREEKA